MHFSEKNTPLWDISPLVGPHFPLWPQSQALERTLVCDLTQGDVVSSSYMKATVHLGAHADAPCHYAKNGKAIHECDLMRYLGPCQVLRPKVARASAITRAVCEGKFLAPRLLFATSSFDPELPFQEDFAAFDPDFFEFLGKQNILTVGIDTPSVDLYKAGDLPCHQLANRYDIAILENLDLRGVPQGLYELIALPLKLEGFDASPIRAILRALPVT